MENTSTVKIDNTVGAAAAVLYSKHRPCAHLILCQGMK